MVNDNNRKTDPVVAFFRNLIADKRFKHILIC